MTTKTQNPLSPNARNKIAGKAGYTKRVRPAGEALPPTHQGRGTYVPGDGDIKHAYRKGAFDHLKFKSLGIGA